MNALGFIFMVSILPRYLPQRIIKRWEDIFDKVLSYQYDYIFYYAGQVL